MAKTFQEAYLWIEGARPKTLIASISPVMIGTAIAYKYQSCSLLIFLAILFTALFLQIGTNLSNDYFDYKQHCDTKERIGPRRLMQAQLVSVDAMKKAIFLSFLLAAFSSSYLIVKGGLFIAPLFSIAIFLAIAYSAKPFSLAYRGSGDILVFFFFGSFATCITTYLHTGIVSKQAFFSGIGPGAISTALLTINNLRDAKTDEKVKKKTLVVRFGQTFGKGAYTFFFLTAIVCPLIIKIFFHTSSYLLLPSFFILSRSSLLSELWKAKTPESYVPLLSKTSYLLFFYTFFFALGSL